MPKYNQNNGLFTFHTVLVNAKIRVMLVIWLQGFNIMHLVLTQFGLAFGSQELKALNFDPISRRQLPYIFSCGFSARAKSRAML